MKSILDWAQDVATILAGGSTVVVTAVVLGGVTGPPERPPVNPLGQVEGWEKYAEGGHRIGPSDAEITILEFGDYQCPFCRVAATQIVEIMAAYDGQVAFVYRHYPLDAHPRANAAAQTAECAAQQGKFWEVHDLLYSDPLWQTGDAHTGLMEVADRAGVSDMARFRECLTREETMPIVVADATAAAELGLTGTPSFLVNEQRHVGSGVLVPDRFRRIYESLQDGR